MRWFKKKEFDPWKDVTEAVHFYDVVTTEYGDKIALQRCDFNNHGGEGWEMNLYNCDSFVNPKEYRRCGSDAFGDSTCYSCGEMTDEEAWNEYSALLLKSVYLPMEKITEETPEGHYWMRFDIPPYKRKNG